MTGYSGRLHFLDGARGWAAVAVAYGHVELWLRPVAQANGYGLVHDLIYTSPFGVASEVAVTLFFVISGFALSLPVLISGNRRRTLRNMAAYRYFRLAIPVLATCILAYALWRTGAFFNGDAGRLSGSDWFAKFYQFPHGPPSVVRFALFDTYFGHIASDESWNSVLWTMSIELIGSFALFAFLALFSSTRIRVVLALVAAAILGAGPFFGLERSLSDYFGFPAGYLAAEFAVSSIDAKKWRRAGPALLVAALAFGIFCITPFIPSEVRRAIDPQCGRNLCAFLLFAGILLSPRTQAALSTPISRFMGDISFSLYLTHFLVLCSVGAGTYVFAERHGWTATTTLLLVIAAAAVSFLAAAVCFNVAVEKWVLIPVKRTLLAAVDRLAGRGRPAERVIFE